MAHTRLPFLWNKEEQKAAAACSQYLATQSAGGERRVIHAVDDGIAHIVGQSSYFAPCAVQPDANSDRS